MAAGGRALLVPTVLLALLAAVVSSCSDGQCKLLDECSSDGDCQSGLRCYNCPGKFSGGSRCVRAAVSSPFYLLNNSLPFNKYAYLATHNSFANINEPYDTGKPKLTFYNQEDTVTEQLNNGVRALMLDVYDYEGQIWLCHSFMGQCHAFTAFRPAIDTMREIEAFLSTNPTEIVTLMLEDYTAAGGLTRLFNDSGLAPNYWFPVARMPKNGEDWPLVQDMVAAGHRLLVFTSVESKEAGEGIAYQWNYIVENQYGSMGLGSECFNRVESRDLSDRSRSLVLLNYFSSLPVGAAVAANCTRKTANDPPACENNSQALVGMLGTCYYAAGNRWANFVAIDYYKRSGGGGGPQAADTLNGRLMCGCDDIHVCMLGSTANMCTSF